MTTLGSLRRIAATTLLLASVVVPAASPAAAAPTPSAAHHAAVRAVIEPPLPVEEFPAQVEEACAIWRGLDWPQANRPLDYPAGPGLVIRGSNVYGNRSGDLPKNGRYREYDVNPRTPGTHRDAERLVRDPDTHTVWYTGDHYANFREISEGCS
ncbi:ribonuclease domain-containing protein [Kitasatospora sp. NPDC058218]|uniref:ribonuclease domain-containing protein n=1 Tax=Kitasatospora sp. NPDC058218 TaxID=3346385 RepID=UPI0036D8E052